MLLPEEFTVIHQPARLQLMTLLYRHGDVGFTESQKALGMTPGNLDAHHRRLGEAGLLQSRKVLLRGGFEVRLRITPEGLRLFESYLGWLESFLATAKPTGSRSPGSADPAPT